MAKIDIKKFDNWSDIKAGDIVVSNENQYVMVCNRSISIDEDCFTGVDLEDGEYISDWLKSRFTKLNKPISLCND